MSKMNRQNEQIKPDVSINAEIDNFLRSMIDAESIDIPQANNPKPLTLQLSEKDVKQIKDLRNDIKRDPSQDIEQLLQRVNNTYESLTCHKDIPAKFADLKNLEDKDLKQLVTVNNKQRPAWKKTKKAAGEAWKDTKSILSNVMSLTKNLVTAVLLTSYDIVKSISIEIDKNSLERDKNSLNKQKDQIKDERNALSEGKIPKANQPPDLNKRKDELQKMDANLDKLLVANKDELAANKVDRTKHNKHSSKKFEALFESVGNLGSILKGTIGLLVFTYKIAKDLTHQAHSKLTSSSSNVSNDYKDKMRIAKEDSPSKDQQKKLNSGNPKEGIELQTMPKKTAESKSVESKSDEPKSNMPGYR